MTRYFKYQNAPYAFRSGDSGSLILPGVGRSCGLMKLLPRFAAIVILGLSSLNAVGGPIDLKPDDSIVSILRAQAGQVVELRLGSGEKLGGKIEKIGENLVHLSQLTGQEFFEAVVDLNAISAVIVRAKAK